MIDSDLFTTEYHTPGFSQFTSILSSEIRVSRLRAFNFRDESMDSPLRTPFFNRSYQSRYFHGEAGDRSFRISSSRLSQPRDSGRIEGGTSCLQ